MSGYQEAELLKLRLTALYRRGDQAQLQDEADATHYSCAAGFPSAQRFVTKDGAKRWVSVSASDLPYEADVALYSTVQIQDITNTFAIHTATTGGVEHAICYRDLDQFKVINDTCGHAAGDQLLRPIADTPRHSDI